MWKMNRDDPRIILLRRGAPRLLREILMTRSLDILSRLRKWKPILVPRSSSHGLAHVDCSSTAWIKAALKHSSLSAPEGSPLTFQAVADACVTAITLVLLRHVARYFQSRWQQLAHMYSYENSLNKESSPALLFLFCCCDLHYWFFFFLYRKIHC